MTGGGKNLKAQPRKAENIAVVIIAAALGQQIGIVRVTGGMGVVPGTEIDRRAGLLHDGLNGADVVIMAVSQKNGLTAQAVVFQIIQNGVALITGVNDDTAEGFLVRHDVAVGLQLADRDAGRWIRPRHRKADS